MLQSVTPSIRCSAPDAVPLTAMFDGPHLTSDGGLVWLAEVDVVLGLSTQLAARFPIGALDLTRSGGHLEAWGLTIPEG